MRKPTKKRAIEILAKKLRKTIYEEETNNLRRKLFLMELLAGRVGISIEKYKSNQWYFTIEDKNRNNILPESLYEFVDIEKCKCGNEMEI